MGEKLRRGFGSTFTFGRAESIERLSVDQRSPVQQARLDAGHWAQDHPWAVTAIAGIVPVLLGGIVGIASNQWLAGVAAVLVSIALVYGFAFLVFLWRAPRKAHDAARAEAIDLRDQVRVLREQAPKLTLGRVLIPEYGFKHPLSGNPHHYIAGKVLKVPVTVSRGSENAKSVQARLCFQPDDKTGWMSPRNPCDAEWATEDGSEPTRVDIPSNGLPMHFNVAFVADEGHPAIFVWTKESRENGMGPRTFGVATGRAQIHVEVSGSGHGSAAPHVEDTLLIELYNGMLHASWASDDGGERASQSPRPERRFMPG